jgi:flagellar basal body rod protein FlgC
MLQAANDYQANLKSLEVGNQMQKSLLNILA